MAIKKNKMSQQGNPLSRREFLIRSGIVGAGALSLPTLLAACGGGDGGDGADVASLMFENWPLYIDEETVALFAAASGVDFKYTEAYNDNNEYFAKVQPSLSAGKSIAPDIVAPTFWMAARWIQLGWAQKINMANIPNSKNLRDDLSSPSWDPNNEYQMPWQTGIAGIAYNIKTTGRELKSVADLFDPAFKGKIGMLTEMRDTLGLVLMGEGKSLADIATYDDAVVGFDKIEKAKSDGQIRAFTGNDYTDDLSSGNFAACVAWSGDVLQLSKDNPDVRFYVPEEGGTSWYDTMLWVTGSENGAAVEKWFDYVYDPVNAARITASVQYISPVKGVQDELVNMGGDSAKLAEDALLFPDAATIGRLQSWGALSEEEEAKFDERFSEITGA
ncbi:MAG: ABC transporter substrate-binding protein [Ilumatobacteraceae bacterium]